MRPRDTGSTAGYDVEIPAQPDAFFTSTQPYRTRPTHLWAVTTPPATAPA